MGRLGRQMLEKEGDVELTWRMRAEGRDERSCFCERGFEVDEAMLLHERRS